MHTYSTNCRCSVRTWKNNGKSKNGVFPQGYGADNMVARRREGIYRDI